MIRIDAYSGDRSGTYWCGRPQISRSCRRVLLNNIGVEIGEPQTWTRADAVVGSHPEM